MGLTSLSGPLGSRACVAVLDALTVGAPSPKAFWSRRPVAAPEPGLPRASLADNLTACLASVCAAAPRPAPALCAASTPPAEPAQQFDRLLATGRIVERVRRWPYGLAIYQFLRLRGRAPAPSRSAPHLILRVRRAGSRIHYAFVGPKGRSIARVSTTPLAPAPSDFRPLIQALAASGFVTPVGVLVENLVPLPAVRTLKMALLAAGWRLAHERQRAPVSDKGAFTCPPGRFDTAALPSEVIGGVYDGALVARVTPTALYLGSQKIVPLRDGRWPGRLNVDGPKGFFIHPLRLALGRRLSKRRLSKRRNLLPQEILVIPEPGAKVTLHLLDAISYTALQVGWLVLKHRVDVAPIPMCRDEAFRFNFSYLARMSRAAIHSGFSTNQGGGTSRR